MSETKSRRVLITGSSSGFGYEGAKALAARGHTVVAAMRGVSGKNKEVADGLLAWAAEGGHKLHVVELDVTDTASVQAGVARAVELAGGLDTVMNNAGVGTMGIQESFTPEQLQGLFDVNVVGPLRVNRAVLPHFRKAGGGHIIFVSSGLGRLVFPFLGPYTATKFAVEALAENLAIEVKPLGVEVTIIQPGAYGTDFGQHSVWGKDGAIIDEYGGMKQGLEAFLKGFEDRFKSGAIGNPAEVTETYVKVVELPAGERPLRVTVGKDVEQGVGAINQACAAVQAQILGFLGFK